MTRTGSVRKRARDVSSGSARSTRRSTVGAQPLAPLTASSAWARTLSMMRHEWAQQSAAAADLEPARTCRPAQKTASKKSARPRAPPSASDLGAFGWTPSAASLVVSSACDESAMASPSTRREPQYDRYDVAGSAHVNELVLRHVPLSDPSAGRDRDSEASDKNGPLSFFQRVSAAAHQPHARRGSAHARGTAHQTDTRAASSAVPTSENAAPVVFALHRYAYNLVKSLVHPLHNYLQLHQGLHNADEIQIMLMPKTGAIAEADSQRRRRRGAPLDVKGARLDGAPVAVTTVTMRHCYVATNQETLSDAALAAAVESWGTLSVFQIDGLTLVHGRPGRHAELKLLAYLQTEILRDARVRGLRADEKVMIAGERLPCAVCRLMAVRHECHAQLLPSHGHFYLATATAELLESCDVDAGTAKTSGEEQRCADVPHAIASRHTAASRLLLSAKDSLAVLCAAEHPRSLK